MTNTELNTFITTKLPDNTSNLITPDDVRSVFLELVKRLSITKDTATLTTGLNNVTHTFGDVPGSVQFFQYIPGLTRTIPIAPLDWWAEDATKDSKIIVNVPEDMANIIIKLTP